MDDHISFAYTHGMDREAIERYLREGGTGVLALAADDDAYAIPVAYHYEDGSIFFRLGETPDSKKRAFVDTTDTATFVVYEADPTDDPRGLNSWSIVLTGSLHAVPGDDPGYDAAAINEQFAPIRVFDENLDDIELTLYRLEIDTVTGRTTPE